MILMIHDRAGMQPYTLKHAETYAALGYVVFAADFFGYGQGILPKDVPEAQAQMGDLYQGSRATKGAGAGGLRYSAEEPYGRRYQGRPDRRPLRRHGRRRVRLDRRAARRQRFDPRLVFDHPEGWAQTVKGKFLILHGAEDAPFPLPKVAQVINELRKAKVDFQLELYSGAGHGFSVPKSKAEERANAQSIASTGRSKKVFAQN